MSNTVKLPSNDLCTGCGVCAFICPTKSIVMSKDKMGSLYPEIDYNKCIHCHKCERVCPVSKNYFLDSSSSQVYVAWNNSENDRNNAASGGIATAIYNYSISNGAKTFGVEYIPKEGAFFKEIKGTKDIEACRNSKYVFSDIKPIFSTVEEYLKLGYEVVLIALPCQIAAVRSLLGNKTERLTLIDIVCHGVCPEEYLSNHIERIEKRARRVADAVLFRDPAFGTHKFLFTCYHNKSLFYKRRVKSDDVYQLGYHKSLIYRNNCYNCQYATPDRLGDITISDFSGLGKIEPFNYSSESVSCVIVNSQKGAEFFSKLINSKSITAFERPRKEAYNYERQLNHPSVPHKNRSKFVSYYYQTQDFEISARKSLKQDIFKNRIYNIFRIDFFKSLLSKILPRRLKIFIKGLLK